MPVAPELLLAKTWTPATNPTGYWMSEKLDGVRAYWTGSDFISRLGNVFHAPDWFKERLPKDVSLDGELWMERGSFQLLVGTVKRHEPNENWKKIRYLVFDCPFVNHGFERRMEILKHLVFEKYQSDHLKFCRQKKCQGLSHVYSTLDATIEIGGEGLMLREPESLYVGKRSSTLLKVKKFLDAEAVVIGHQPGKGKHVGRLGALICKLPDGTEFDIGTGFTDLERENPPKIGSIVTVKFQELTKDGCPRFPSYWRNDV